MTRRLTHGRWRAAVLGLASTSGLLGTGCLSAERALDPPVEFATVRYPGLPSAAPTPRVTPPGPASLASAPVAPAVSPVSAAVSPVSAAVSPVSAAAPPVDQLRPAEFVGPAVDHPAPVGGGDRAEAVSPPVPAEAIDLGVALRLAGVDNPTIGLAREQVREALAGQLAARSLLLPTVNIGGNYRDHTGPLQDDPGEFRRVNLQSLYLGFGAGAVGTGPAVFPGVRLFAHLGDAVYEPLAARQRVAASRSDAQAVRNQVLLDVAVAYLELVEAETRLDILRGAEAEVSEVARVTAEFARTGQGAPPDANRAAGRTELVRRQVRQAEGGAAAASARLARLLNLDPSVRLRTPGGPVEAFRLLPEDGDIDTLLGTATQARPELASRTATIREAQTRVRQEQVRPFVPTVSAGFSAGLFGGGGTLGATDFGPMGGRSDFDLVAVWNVQNLGFGNRARVRAAGATVGRAVAGYETALNLVRREVASAQADARAAAGQIAVARAAVAAAEEGYKRERERVRRGEGRPIEALDSFRQLLDARLELLRTVIAFDVAQFRLYAAVGSNPATGPGCATPGP